MDLITMLFGLALVVGALAAFGLAALRWGTDSRDGSVTDPSLAHLGA